jgi:hypothetical protein
MEPAPGGHYSAKSKKERWPDRSVNLKTRQNGVQRPRKHGRKFYQDFVRDLPGEQPRKLFLDIPHFNVINRAVTKWSALHTGQALIWGSVNLSARGSNEQGSARPARSHALRTGRFANYPGGGNTCAR